jgi:hypothetical protein
VLALYSDEKVHEFGWQLDAPTVAAALRAAADHVVSESTEPNRTINIEPEKDVVFIGAWHIWNTQRKVRSQLLAIAAELGDTSPTSEGDY